MVQLACGTGCCSFWKKETKNEEGRRRELREEQHENQEQKYVDGQQEEGNDGSEGYECDKIV